MSAAAVRGRRRPRHRRRPRPAAGRDGLTRILLASEGRPFTDDALARVLALAGSGASVRVFSVARVHGVAFGMPNPGLLPTRREWREQHDIVEDAVVRLKRRGLRADGHVVGTRNATKKILQEARALGSEAIVMGADAHRLIAGMMWTQEAQRVHRGGRRDGVPVHLVR